MKSKITPIVSFLCILTFFLGPTVLAQSPLRVAPKKINLTERSKTDHFSSSSKGDSTSENARHRKVSEAAVASMAPKMIADTSENKGPLNTTQPKVVLPTTHQIKKINKEVEAKVSALKSQAGATFSILEHDNVALHYNADSGKIELSALNHRNTILQEVVATTLKGVLVIEGNDRDNNLVVDNTILDLGIDIVYDGRGEHTATGDVLTVVNNGSSWEEVVSTAFNKSSGHIVVDAKSSITYTGLEPIILLDAGGATLIFNLPNVPNPDVVIENAPTPNLTAITGSTFENTFYNGFGAVIINGGTSIDNVSFRGLDPLDPIPVTLNFDTDDVVTFETTETNLGAGDLTLNTGFLLVRADITTTGNINLTSERNTIVNNTATLSITDGAITMLAGTTPVVGDIYNGILLQNASLTATTGSISLTGTGSNDGTISGAQGVYIIGNSIIETTEGAIEITGAGASSGIESQNGIRINDSATDTAKLSSLDGNITLNGTGGIGTSRFQTGVFIDGVNPIQLTGMGSLEVIGQGGTGANASYGVAIRNGTTMVADGGIIINGTSGNGSGNFQAGVVISRNALIEVSGSGNLDVTGVGGTGVQQNTGISIQTAQITLENGNLTLDGTAGNGTADLMIGVTIDNSSTIGVTGPNGSVTIEATGGAGSSDNSGFYLQNSSITTAGGGVTVTAEGGTGSNFNRGIFIWPDGVISDTMDGDIQLMGTAGAGTGQFNTGVNQEGTVQTLDGNISITGVGDGTFANNKGVEIADTATIVSTGTGPGVGQITINGTGANGNNLFNIGVLNLGIVQSMDADITIIGQGNGTNNENYGINIFENGLVQSTGEGAISFTGTGANGNQENRGILLDGVAPRVLSNNGAITFNGFGGNAIGNSNEGIELQNGSTISASGAGAINLNGTGGDAFSGNYGVLLEGTTTSVTSNGGGISMTGIAGNGGGNNNMGIRVDGASITDLSSTGAISLDGTGGSGPGLGNEIGVFINSGTPITSSGGEISITGAGGSGTGDLPAGIYMDGAILDTTNLGAITLDGMGGSGAEAVMGVYLFETSLTSASGAIMATGTGGVGTGDFANGIYIQDTAVASSSGNITLDGTGGSGDTTNEGILSFTSSITTVDGAIQITGESIDTTGDFNEGIAFIENIVEATNGNVSLVGTASSAIYPGIMIFTANVPIIAGSTITVTTAVGPINTPEGIPTTAIFEAPSTIVNGAISPGDYTELAIGQTIVTGNFEIGIGDTYEVNINGVTTAGTDFDQLVINGTVTITDATLNVAGSLGGPSGTFDVITLIENDGVDAVEGTFLGLPNASPVSYNGETWFVYYDQGDGNDVVLRANPINVIVDASGNLVYTDPAGEDDELTIIIEGGNYRISDPNKPVIAGQGAIQDGNEVLVPIVSVTEAINMNTEEGDDSINVALDGGDFGDTINYNGGNQNTSLGDSMLLSSAGLYANVTHNFINESDGFVAVTGNNTINYTGLEPILDNLNAADRVFNFTGGAETITVNAGGTLDNQIDSTLGESVDFNNPTNSLTINTEVGGGSGADTVNMDGIALGFDADLTINGGTDDGVNFQSNPTAIGTGNLAVTGLSIFVFEDITTSGLGAINFTADRNIYVQPLATVSSQDGAITFIANSSGALSTTQDFDAILINGEVNTSGTGSIDFTGNGGSTGATEFNIGIAVEGANAKVETTGAGAITMTGTGGPGSNNNSGVMVSFGGIVAANGGAIDITGNGGSDGFGIENIGVRLRVNGTISNSGAGTISLNGTGADNGDSNYGVLALGGSNVTTINGEISIDGTGGNGFANNHGVRIQDSGTSVSSANGGITFNGTGGIGTANNNEGIVILLDAVIETTGTGAIDMIGSAQNGAAFNKGIIMFGNGSTVRTNGGGITMTGLGAGTGNSNYGISLEGGPLIEDISNGNITLLGTGGNGISDNFGVITRNGTRIRTVTGQIDLTGFGGNGTGSANIGVIMDPTTTISSLSGGDINLTGQAGTGISFNKGLELVTSVVTSNGGNIALAGTGGMANGVFNQGVTIRNNAAVSTVGAGTITLNGVSGTGADANWGAEVVTNGTVFSTENGDISITGIAADVTGADQRGVFIETEIVTTGTGNIEVTGTAGNPASRAIFLEDFNSRIL